MDVADVADAAGGGGEVLAARRRLALGAALEFCLGRAGGACKPSDVRWLRALCGACGAAPGAGLAVLRVAALGEGSAVLENWASDFSRAKFEALFEELGRG